MLHHRANRVRFSRTLKLLLETSAVTTNKIKTSLNKVNNSLSLKLHLRKYPEWKKKSMKNILNRKLHSYKCIYLKYNLTFRIFLKYFYVQNGFVITYCSHCNFKYSSFIFTYIMYITNYSVALIRIALELINLT